MVERINGLFDRFDLSEAEHREAPKLTNLQASYLQNLLYDVLEEKMSLAVNLAKPMEFEYTHEYLRGQADILKMILTLSKEAHTNTIQQQNIQE